MPKKGESGKEYHCYSRFIYNHGQKPSLTRVTDSRISSTFYRLYPILIIFDGALNNILWICDDIWMPFIYTILASLVVNTLVLVDPVESLSISSINKISIVWLGMIGFVTLVYSFLYYVITVYQDLEQYEPPTLDDIVILLESVIDKLETIRKEALWQVINIDNWIDALKLTIYLTPIQLLLTKYLSVKDYTLWIVWCCSLFHSVWFQSTLRLFWRVLVTRKAYYSVTSIFYKHQQIVYNPIGDVAAVNHILKTTQYVPYPSQLKNISGKKVQLELLKLYPFNENYNERSKRFRNKGDIAINEYIIHENQRKWKPDNHWKPKLLSYEKPKYCIEINEHLYACTSPWEFQESFPDDWEWLDDCWKPTDWVYSDTKWKITGKNDSLEAYTRTKIWRRRAFKNFK